MSAFGSPAADEIAAAREAVRAQLARTFEVVPVRTAHTWVGVAGTFTTLAALAHRLDVYDPAAIHLSRVPLRRLAEVTSSLIAMPRSERAALGPMHEGRVDVIGGGSIVVEELARELSERAGITELVVSEHDILDGIAISLR